MATATKTKVKRADLVELFEALGKDTAKDWGPKRLQEKAAQLPSIAKNKAELADKLSDKHKALLEEIRHSVKDGEELEIVGAEKTEDKPKDKKKDKGKKSSDKGKDKKEDKSKDKKPAPVKAASKEEPGVIASIIEFLSLGNSKIPVTREELLKKLKQRFPNRDEAGMRVTVVSQVPLRIGRRGYDVQGDITKGFWIRKAKKEKQVMEEND